MKKLYFLFSMLLITCLSFGQVFITEIADPNNNAEARYIELYNAGASPVDFTEGNGWQIDKYLNANTDVNTSIDLTGTIPAGGFYIIAYDNTPGTFQSVYGFAPDQLDGVNNGVAGSNGDDDLALVDGSDTIVDFYGVYDFGAIPNDPSDDVNTDNTTTCAEYEDGRAERLISVTMGSSSFNEAEWNIWADSATSGTCTNYVVATRDAPGDFDPGAWGTPSCDFSLNNGSATCDAITSGTDTYTATVDFTGGGTTTYTVSSDSGVVDLSAGNPTNDATGTITVTGVMEGTDVVINVTDGSVCDVNYTVFSADCEPALTLPLYDNFTYADGPLVNAPNWNNFSGTTGDLQVSSGQAMVNLDGSLSEDASIAFTPVSGDIYYAFDFTVNDPGAVISGGDYEYFAMFKDDATIYRARIDIVEANSGGDFTVGISTTGSTADVVWATDLSFGTTYRATIRYNQPSNIAELWIDAASESDTSILGTDQADPGTDITQFALRQSGSSSNESILIDNLAITTSFDETLSGTDFSSKSENLKIFPNPTATGSVTIMSTNSAPMNVKVFDILGKQVKNETINTILDVSDLKSGIYILNISQESHTVTKKLVVE